MISYLYHRKNTARWIPSLELAANTGIRERGVRYCIRALVIKGEPIATKSGPGGGFKFVEDAEELAASRDRLMKEARSIFYRLGRQQRSQILQELAGQERLSADSADSADCKSALPRAISQEEIR